MSTRASDLIGVLPWLLAVAFPVLWFSVLGAISAFSGWSMLARRYRTTGPAPFDARRFLSGSLGSVRFNNALTVGHSPNGLYLSVLLPFRPFHPPLLVPWASVHQNPPGRSWFRTYDSLAIRGDGGAVELRLYGGVAADFAAFLRASRP
jgi:hypothetical protein